MSVVKLEAALNTANYLGGSPVDGDGRDSYLVYGWSKSSKLNRLVFILSEGDATQIKLQIFDRHAYLPDAKLIHEEVLGKWSYKTYDPPIEIHNVEFNRLNIVLTALDGIKQNHCQLSFQGEAL